MSTCTSIYDPVATGTLRKVAFYVLLDESNENDYADPVKRSFLVVVANLGKA